MNMSLRETVVLLKMWREVTECAGVWLGLETGGTMGEKGI